ncbi:hypothetical protein [Serratia sp. ser-z]
MTLTTEQLRANMIEKIAVASGLRARDGRNFVAKAIYAEVVEPLLAANREAQPVPSGENCWSCGKFFTYAQHSECDGYCPHCDAPVDLDEGEEGAAPPAPANANAVAWEIRYWNSGHNMWHDWERITAEQHAEMSVQHATDNDYEFRVLYDAPVAKAAPEGGN